MLELIPSQAAMVELVGRPLYEVWQALCSLMDENMIWNDCGIPAEKSGPTNTNIVEVGKHFAAYTQRNIASVVWLSLEKMSG